MAHEPEDLVPLLLRQMRADMVELKSDLSEMKSDMAEIRSGMSSLRTDFASDIARLESEIGRLEKQTREQIAGLRRAVVEYHSSVIGHGMLISELEERKRRVEQRLGLPAPGSH